jgi:hypothetical protein
MRRLRQQDDPMQRRAIRQRNVAPYKLDIRPEVAAQEAKASGLAGLPFWIGLLLESAFPTLEALRQHYWGRM